MHPLVLTGITKIIATFAVGFLFGFVLLRSRLALRDTFINQLSFKDNTFAITFLFSIAVGIPLFYFASHYNIIKLDNPGYHFWGIIYGAIVTGIGLGICGHIPITAIASFGSGRIYSLFVLIGMLTAIPAIRQVQPIINDYVLHRTEPFNVNALAQTSIFYNGETTMLYFLPLFCLILALFLRLIQPKQTNSKNKK